MLTQAEPTQQTTCFECGAPLPQVRLYCGLPAEKSWPADEDGCGARMCSESCGKAHTEKHVEKTAEVARRMDEQMRRRRERTGLR